MRYLALVFACLATPALAHHEAVVATSLVPAAYGVAVILTAACVALRRKLRRKDPAKAEQDA